MLSISKLPIYKRLNETAARKILAEIEQNGAQVDTLTRVELGGASGYQIDGESMGNLKGVRNRLWILEDGSRLWTIMSFSEKRTWNQWSSLVAPVVETFRPLSNEVPSPKP